MKTLESFAVLFLVLGYFGVLIYEFCHYLVMAIQFSYKITPFVL